MSLRDFFRRNDPDTNVINRAEIISRYKHLRAVGRKLNHKMVERLSKDVLHEGARNWRSCGRTFSSSTPRTNLQS